MISLILIILIVLLLVVCLAANLVVVPYETEYIIERKGLYAASWGAGLHWKTPFLDRIVNKVSLKEQVVVFQRRPMNTNDHETILIQASVTYRVTDSHSFTYGMKPSIQALEDLTATALQGIIINLDYNAMQTRRDNIQTQVATMLDGETEKLGIRITRVEIQNPAGIFG